MEQQIYTAAIICGLFANDLKVEGSKITISDAINLAIETAQKMVEAEKKHKE